MISTVLHKFSRGVLTGMELDLYVGLKQLAAIGLLHKYGPGAGAPSRPVHGATVVEWQRGEARPGDLTCPPGVLEGFFPDLDPLALALTVAEAQADLREVIFMSLPEDEPPRIA